MTIDDRFVPFDQLIPKKPHILLEDILEEAFKLYGITPENVAYNVDRIRIDEYPPVENPEYTDIINDVFIDEKYAFSIRKRLSNMKESMNAMTLSYEVFRKENHNDSSRRGALLS